MVSVKTNKSRKRAMLHVEVSPKYRFVGKCRNGKSLTEYMIIL